MAEHALDAAEASGPAELTLRLALMASEHFAVDYCLSSVRPEHASFYRRVFLCEQMGPSASITGSAFRSS